MCKLQEWSLEPFDEIVSSQKKDETSGLHWWKEEVQQSRKMALADAMIVQPVVEFFEPHAMQQSTIAMSHVVEGHEPTELELIT
jgi:hypothetical protein